MQGNDIERIIHISSKKDLSLVDRQCMFHCDKMVSLVRRILLLIMLGHFGATSVRGASYNDTMVVSVYKASIIQPVDYVEMTLQLSNSMVQIVSSRSTTFTASTRFASVAFDIVRDRLYMHDLLSATLYEEDGFTRGPSTSASNIHRGTSNFNVKIACDWVSNNLYWADPLYKWIAVKAVGKDKAYYTILVHDDLEYPMGLAVDQINKYLFWGDGVSTPRIERSLLDGTDRRTLISQGILRPVAIDVDIVESKIVWLDSDRDTIEIADFDGANRRMIRRLANSNLLDVAIYRSTVVFATDPNTKSLIPIDVNTGETVSVSGFPLILDALLGIAVYSSSSHTPQTDPCATSLCTDICVRVGTGTVCLCRAGFTLQANGYSCTEISGSFHKALVYSNSSSICLADVRAASHFIHYNNQSCIYTSGTSIHFVGIDSHAREVIFSDRFDIRKLNVDSPASTAHVTTATAIITGLAIDWRDGNVYWCQGTTAGVINLASQSSVYTLISNNLYYPRLLTVQPLQNLMIWVSGAGLSYDIQHANLDGSSRGNIDVDLTSVPVDLTVDTYTNKLYYIANGVFHSCNLNELNNANCQTLESDSQLTGPTAFFIYKNFLVVNDATGDMITYKSSNLTSRRAEAAVTVVTDMNILDESLQPNQLGDL